MHFDFEKPHEACSGVKEGWYECTMGADKKPKPSGLSSNVVKEFTNYAEHLRPHFVDGTMMEQ